MDIVVLLPSFYLIQSTFGPARYSAAAISRFGDFLPESKVIDLDAAFLKFFGVYSKEFSIVTKKFCLKMLNSDLEPLKKKLLTLLDEHFNCSNVDNIICSIPAFYVGEPNQDDILLYFNYIILDYLRKKYPSAFILLGGIGLYQIVDKKFEELDFSIVDKIYHYAITSKKEFLKLLHIDSNDTHYYSPHVNEIVNSQDLEYSYSDILTYSNIEKSYKVPNKYIKMFSMKLSQGCVGRCAFCGDSDLKLKIYNPGIVYDNIKRYHDFGYNAMFLLDCSVNPTRKVAENLCNFLVKNNLDITWSASCRFHDTDYDFFKMMQEAGCRRLCFGSETVSDKVLNYIQKDITRDKIIEGLENSHRAGIWNLLNFIFGLPYETYEDALCIIEFILEYHEYIDECVCNKFFLNPFSLFFRQADKFNLQVTSNINPKVEKVKSGPIFQFITEYSEIYGRSSQEIQEYTQNILRIINSTIVKEYVKVVPIHLTLMLLDVFKGDKAKARAFLKSNNFCGCIPSK